MLKRERLQRILQMVNDSGIVTAAEITKSLNVSDMTIRRDLDELEKSGKLIRVRGGAQSLNYNIDFELSHMEKSEVHMQEKEEIASAAASLIHDHDTIFLGPGTTIELLAGKITQENVRVITTSLPVFEVLATKKPDSVLLIGGEFRSTTRCFAGPLTTDVLKRFKFNIAFISSNGIAEDGITTSSIEEGNMQEVALNNARYRYLLADSSKFNREDYYVYYHLYNLDGIITDSNASEKTLEHYNSLVQIMQVGKDTK